MKVLRILGISMIIAIPLILITGSFYHPPINFQLKNEVGIPATVIRDSLANMSKRGGIGLPVDSILFRKHAEIHGHGTGIRTIVAVLEIDSISPSKTVLFYRTNGTLPFPMNFLGAMSDMNQKMAADAKLRLAEISAHLKKKQ